MKTYTIDGKTATFFPGTDKKSPLVVLVSGTEGCLCIPDQIHKRYNGDFSLIVVMSGNMKEDCVPWDAVDPFDDALHYTSHADAFIAFITGAVLPEIKADNSLEPEFQVLAGYSYGGLLAIYSMFRTDAFSRITCVASSFWYPGVDILTDTAMMHRVPDKAYFSVKKTAGGVDPLTKLAEINTTLTRRACAEAGSDTTLELIGAESFYDPLIHIAKGIAWTLEPPRK